MPQNIFFIIYVSSQIYNPFENYNKSIKMPITSSLTGKTIPIMPISMLISLMNETKPSFITKPVFSRQKAQLII